VVDAAKSGAHCIYLWLGDEHVTICIAVSKFVNEDRLPHLLLYGPPGTGKTSTILAVARQIYSSKEFNSMVLEV
jgi:replication factor C subunit 3/5